MKFCENSVKLVNSNVEWTGEDYAWDIAFYIEKIARNGTQTQDRDNAMTRPIEFCRNAWNARPRRGRMPAWKCSIDGLSTWNALKDFTRKIFKPE